MRKMISVCLLAAVAVWGTGCIVAIGTTRPICPEQVVVIDGEFHVVNTKTHKIRKFEVEPVEESITVEIEESNDD